MRPYLLSLVLLLAATVPLVSAICISRFEKSESKSEAHGNGGSVKTLSLEEYGLPKRAVEKPKEVNPYEAATSAKASTASDKPEEPSAPKKVKKEKSDDSDVSAAYLKKLKKEKSSDSDKKEKKKFVDFDVSASPKKEKKEKSDESASKKKKKDKSDVLSPNKKEKKSDEDASAKKAKKAEEKKKKALKADASAYFKKEKKAEKAKHKKGKSSNDSSDEEDEDAAPVDVSAAGEYVSPDVAKSEEDTTPAGISSVPTELAPAAKGYADDYASQNTQQQPMGGAPDELPPSAKSSAAASTSQQPMGGAPDELPPSSTKSSGDPYAGVPTDLKKPKLPMESFEAMKMKLPFPRPHVPVSPETKRVCGDTQYPEDCEESIAEIPGVESQPAATDPVAVLRLAMEAVREKTVVALNAATERMNAGGLEKVVKEALNDCAKSYMDIKAALGEVDAALKRGDLATARTNLDSVETDLTSCDDGFDERGTPSVMTDHDQELQKLASDLIAIGANSIHHP
ncbi:unnamed protein product [Urochloa decumbens]|uniref:Pectinesterase inhibitor domain-containing protein n=1 Tax=Urochloa decumbens TaxID=240449 RepID=A0ABC9APG4_9POAL